LLDAWRVFSQQAEPVVAAAEWKRAAERFFDTKLVVAPESIEIEGAARRVTGRMRTPADLTDALAAETRTGFTGLYDLAERRCQVVWVVEREGLLVAPKARGLDDTALLIAAILASVCLGPILGQGELFGVRTARAKLEPKSPDR
jgi:hypothetical protein